MTATQVRGSEGIGSAEDAAMTAAVHDDERSAWNIQARVDLFNEESIAACRAYLGLDHEPIGHELKRWSLETRGHEAGDRTEIVDGNLLTRLGLRRLGALFIGETATASQALNVTHCRIGVGDGTATALATDTDLGAGAGSTHRQFNLVDSVAQGTGSNSGVTTIVATFGTGVANFSTGWWEWGIDGGTASGTTVTSESASTPGLCNHKVLLAALLVKTTSVVAVFTVTITITSP